MADAIAEAREQFIAGDPTWAAPLFLDLDRAAPGAGYRWVERCVRTLLPSIRTEHAEELRGDLVVLDGYRRTVPPPEEFVSRARAIWHRPRRDRAVTAVSNLFCALGIELHPGVDWWRTTSIVPVSLIVEASADPPGAFDCCLAEFAAIRHHLEESSPGR